MTTVALQTHRAKQSYKKKTRTTIYFFLPGVGQTFGSRFYGNPKYNIWLPYSHPFPQPFYYLIHNDIMDLGGNINDCARPFHDQGSNWSGGGRKTPALVTRVIKGKVFGPRSLLRHMSLLLPAQEVRIYFMPTSGKPHAPYRTRQSFRDSRNVITRCNFISELQPLETSRSSTGVSVLEL